MESKIYYTYLSNIADKMDEAGITKEKVAQRVGVNRKTVYTWLTGKAAMPAYAIVELSDMVGCTIDELIGRYESEQPTGSDLIALIYDSLNDEGKTAMEEYALMCRLNPHYKKGADDDR